MFLSKLKIKTKPHLLLNRRSFFQNLNFHKPKFERYMVDNIGLPTLGSPTAGNGTRGQNIYHAKEMIGLIVKKFPTLVGSITATAFLMALWPLWLSDTLLWWKGSPSTAMVTSDMTGGHTDVIRPITYAHVDKHEDPE